MNKHYLALLLLLGLFLGFSTQSFAGEKLAVYKITVESETFNATESRVKSSLCSKLKTCTDYQLISEAECEGLMNGQADQLSKTKNIGDICVIAKGCGINFILHGKIYDVNDNIEMELILVDTETGNEVNKVKGFVNTSFSRFVSIDLKKLLNELLKS